MDIQNCVPARIWPELNHSKAAGFTKPSTAATVTHRGKAFVALSMIETSLDRCTMADLALSAAGAACFAVLLVDCGDAFVEDV